MSFLAIQRRDPLSASLYFGVAGVFLVGGIINFADFGWLTPLLEPFIVGLALLSLKSSRLPTSRIFLAMGLLLYVIAGIVLAVVIRKANFLDFFQAYKSFWYLLLLVPLSGARFLTDQDIVRLNRFLLGLFLVIYSIKKFLLDIDRPIVLTENNFELLLVCMLFYRACLIRDRINLGEMLTLGCIVFISGSRSSALCFAIVIAFLLIRGKPRRRDLLAIGGLFAAVVMGAVLFQLRSGSGGVEAIDRVRFFFVFMGAIEQWTWWEYLVGEPRITALPQWACNQLSAYRGLFSYRGDGTCYSVILHSFDMRVIYDHGLLGLMMIVGALWKLLSNVPAKVRLCMVVLLLANGLSVSAINSVYFALGLVFFVGHRYEVDA
ncbi:MAG: hypothetical protein ACN6RJ_04255 [Stenotrophomonas sp.]